MKALLYSLTLLLLSLNVEAADRSHAIVTQPLSVDAVMLQTVPEPAAPAEFDSGMLPVTVTLPEVTSWTDVAVPAPQQPCLKALTHRSIRAPPPAIA